MKNTQPIFDPTTCYTIEVRGRVDLDWLHNFEGNAEISAADPGRDEESTLLKVCTDQSGIVGLLRRLHGLGITILNVQIVTEGEDFTEVDGNH